MYQVLYRKWRPKTFSDVVGQPHITTTLQNELMSNRIAHAYLFTGSRGTGKTTCAKILAKAINCLDLKDGNPCEVCENCKGIENGTIMDIVEIDAASNNGVDNIRDLREESSFTPSVAKYRVYIIDEVHMLSIGAFNALLKTLEEPPEHVVFILATTEVHKLPATILSRCQRFDFHRIEAKDIYSRLKYVAKQEGKELDEDAGMLIASLSDGALRDALSLFDQCIGKTNVVTTEVVTKTAGLAGQEYIFKIVDCIANKDMSTLMDLIDKLYMESKDINRLIEELVEHFRNIMLTKVIDNPSNMMVITKNDYDALLNQAEYFSLDYVIYIMQILEDTIQKINKGLNVKTEIELAMITLCSPQIKDNIEALTKRVEDLENQVNNFDVTPPVKVVKQETPKVAKHAPKKESKPDEQILPEFIATDVSLEPSKKDADIWKTVLDKLQKTSKILATSLAKAKVTFSDNIVYIDGSSLAMSLIDKADKREIIVAKLQEVTGKEYAVKKAEKNTPITQKTIDQSEPLQENKLDNFLSGLDDIDININ